MKSEKSDVDGFDDAVERNLGQRTDAPHRPAIRGSKEEQRHAIGGHQMQPSGRTPSVGRASRAVRSTRSRVSRACSPAVPGQ
jgi:hypothetical protein